MTIVKCDMCGKDIPAIEYRLLRGGARRFESENGESYDFCGDCLKDLKFFIKTHFAATKSGTAVPIKEASE